MYLYSDEEMLLWSIIGALTTPISKFETLKFSPNILFKFFKFSLKYNINVFKNDYKNLIYLIDCLDSEKEKVKLKLFFLDKNNFDSLNKQLKKEKYLMETNNIKYYTYFSKNYPLKIKNYKIPPFVLYYIGNFPSENTLQYSLSIVGSRLIEDYSSNYNFLEQLIKKSNDEIIYNVSGLASGCDTIGHILTMKYDIKNIAILGYGLASDIYPKENLELSNLILKKDGLLLSELPPSSNIKPIYLLQRNRLQIYLSNYLLVLETTPKGGTIKTIKFAFQENKLVFIRKTSKNYALITKSNKSKLHFITNYSDIKKICNKTIKKTLFD